jgi:histidinol phosphatase-like PHP family hydrolase
VYIRRIHSEMQEEIVEQIQAMPNNYTSLEFYTGLEISHPHKCEALIRS